ncbi:hypothetical protein MBLNU230_g7620t1 [Neophaeotheca triangularis]
MAPRRRSPMIAPRPPAPSEVGRRLAEGVRKHYGWIGCHGRTRITQAHIEEHVRLVTRLALSGELQPPSLQKLAQESNPYAELLNGSTPTLSARRGVFQGDISNTNAQALITRHVAASRANVKELGELMNVHGALIEKTVAKINKKTLAKLFQAEMPDMPTFKCWQLPIIYQQFWWYHAKQDRKAWLLPHLTLNDLVEDRKTFLNLANERVDSSPGALFHADMGHLRFGFCAGAFDVPWSSSHVILTGSAHGKLVGQRPLSVQKGLSAPVPVGLLVFEAQAVLSEYLCKTAHKILAEVSNEAKARSLGDSTPRAPAPTVMADLTMSLLSLQEEAVGYLQEAIDNIWLTQTDVHYAQRAVAMLMEKKGDEVFEQVKPGDTWSAAATQLITSITERVTTWKALVDELENVLAVAQRDPASNNIGSEDGLGAELSQALDCLDLLLDIRIDVRRLHVRERFLRQKSFDQYFNKHYDNGKYRVAVDFTAVSKDISPEVDDAGGLAFRDDCLFWCAFQLVSNPEGDELAFPRELLYAQFDNHMDSASTSERARLDAGFLRELNDLRVMEDMHRALHRWTRKSVGIKYEEASKLRLGAVFWSKYGASQERLSSPNPVNGTSKSFRLSKPDLGPFLRDFAELPMAWGNRDVNFYECLSEKRDKLAAFFEAARGYVELACHGRGCSGYGTAANVGLLVHDLEIEHLAKVQEERVTLAALRKSLSTTQQHVPLAAGQLGSLASKPQTKQKTPPAVKQKTRPARNDNAHEGDGPDDPPAAEEEMNPEPEAPKIVVKSNSYRILTAMLPSSQGNSDSSISVRFNNMAAAVIDAGATASENKKGCAVTFKLNGMVVVLHRPHPSPEIDALTLEIMGKMLSKGFGWFAEDFVEGKKGGKE